MAIRQGDQYNIVLKIEVNGNPINMENIELIEFTVGNLSKKWPLEVIFNETDKEFYFPVSQDETFQFENYEQYQVRIKYSDNTVVGSPINKISINDCLSRNII